MRVSISPSAIGGTVKAPPSKSFTHRSVIIGALATGETVVEDYLASDDTRYTVGACRALGVDIKENGGLTVKGTGGAFKSRADPVNIFVGNSGSTIRMMAPVAALAHARVIFDGEARLRERPVGEVLSALAQLGVTARSLEKAGYPPIEIRGGGLAGGVAAVSGAASSQHISALLMAGPYCRKDTVIRITDRLQSRPYVDITMAAMQDFGVAVENRNYIEFALKAGQSYRGRRYRIEGDYSSAAFFFAAAAIGGGRVTVTNLSPRSPQGDRRFPDILAEMGCRVSCGEGQVTVAGGPLRGAIVDMGDYPDIVQPLAVAAAFAAGQTRIHNIGHLRFKESDRIRQTAQELSKMGVEVQVTGETLEVRGGRPHGAEIDAHGDHRMAMSFAVAGLFASGQTIINGAETVSKSYPGFFADLASLGARITELKA